MDGTSSPPAPAPPPTSVPGAAGVAARYFDGRHSQSHDVTLDIAHDRVIVTGETVARDEPVGAVAISEEIGRTPRFLRLSDGALCEVSDYAALGDLLARNGLTRRRLSRWEQSRLAVLVCIAVLVVGGLCGYVFGLPFMARVAAGRLPPSALDTLSAHVLLTLDRTILEPSRLPYDRQVQIVQRFSQLRFPDAAGRRVALLFRRSAAFGANAFALPSGLVVVTDDLTELVGSDEELLAVLAHESGHVVARHGLRNMIQSSVVSILLTWYIGDVSALAAAAPAALLEARYSRELEREADRYAADVLRANRLSPGLLADILERMEAVRTREGGQLPVALGYLSTHPTTAQRLAALRGE